MSERLITKKKIFRTVPENFYFFNGEFLYRISMYMSVYQYDIHTNYFKILYAGTK